MIAWFIAAFVSMVALALARRAVELEEELRIERTLCTQAEAREAELHQQVWRLMAANRDVALKRPMWFRDIPTMDVTVYGADGDVVTYDN